MEMSIHPFVQTRINEVKGRILLIFFLPHCLTLKNVE